MGKPAADSQDRGAGSSTLSVSQLNEQVRRALQGSFPGELWISGEIAGYDRDLPRSKTRSHGQLYFDLTEKEQAGGLVKSTVKAVLWGREGKAISSKLAAIDSRLALRDGL